MTAEKAKLLLIDGMDYAAYKETQSSLYDSDKNRLFGEERFNSGRLIVRPSPWAEGDFEARMAQLLTRADILNQSLPEFAEAQSLLAQEDSLIGRVIREARRYKSRQL